MSAPTTNHGTPRGQGTPAFKFTAFEKRSLKNRGQDPDAVLSTLRDVAALQPQVIDVVRAARAYRRQHLKDRRHFSETKAWCDDLKPWLSRLVGWGLAPVHPTLSTSDAYDAVYEAAYAAIPICRCSRCEEADS